MAESALRAVAGELPRGDVREVRRRRAAPRRRGSGYSSRKWPPQTLAALQRVEAQQLAELEEVRDAAGLLQRLIQLLAVAGDVHVLPELLAQRRDRARARVADSSRCAPCRSCPTSAAELAVEMIDRAPAFDRRATCCVRARTSSSALLELGMIDVGRLPISRREIIADRVRQHEIAVGQPLHQRARAEAVRAVIGEVRFAEHEQARDVATSGCSPPTARPSCSAPPG